MMISIKDVDYMARLARLKFTEEEATTLGRQFQDILSHFEKLRCEDVGDEPCLHSKEGYSYLRKDNVINNPIEKEELFQNTKQMRESCIEIPKVVE